MAQAASVQLQDEVATPLSTEIIIDFRGRSSLDADADRAKELYDLNLTNAQIAARMGCAPNRVTKILAHWHRSRGLAMPSGHRRSFTLSKKEPGVPLSQTLAEDAKALWDEGLAAEQIAAQLGCSSVIAVEAVDHWFSTRNQSLPNHAERQVALMDRLVVWYDQDLPLNEMAAKVGVNALVVRYLLRERLQQLGRTMVDGRKRIVKK